MTAQSFCNWANNTLLPSSHLQPHFPHAMSLRSAVHQAPPPVVQVGGSILEEERPTIRREVG